MKKSNVKKEQNLTETQIRRRTILAFVVFIFLMGSGAFIFYKIKYEPAKDQKNGVQTPLRKVLDGNEKIFSKSLNTVKLAKTFPKSEAAKKVRVNGAIGLKDEIDGEKWRLQLVKNSGDTLLISLDELKKLPKTEIIFDFKCIEGWSQVSHWGGVKFSDFVEAYHLDRQAQEKYIGLITPDEKYYVGIDMKSAMHPQTILTYEMNGKPLPMNQGFPLRLIIPTKYGIKSLKRIGRLTFSNERPKDYWYERGYDYFSGL